MDEPLEEWLTSIQVKLNPSFVTFLFDNIEVFLSNQHCLPVFRNVFLFLCIRGRT